ncbi:MAG: PQQ-dependent sugar dehydrogenase, partial [Candidatus Hydrothermarchaeales archaeon]
MASRKWLIVPIFFVLAIIAYKLIFGPAAPDIGTPGVMTPPQPSPRETPKVSEPDEGLVEYSLVIPDLWKESPLEGRILSMPKGFSISVYASGLSNARFMTLDEEGNIFISQPREGRISVIHDRDNDGVVDEILAYYEGLNLPHGLAFDGDWLYVAENDKVVRLKDEDGDFLADIKETIVNDIPGAGGHFTRTLGFGPDGKMYVSVGSSCNVCEDDPRRATILRFNKDGRNEEIFAKGLRNSVGFVWHPDTGEIWATDN